MLRRAFLTLLAVLPLAGQSSSLHGTLVQDGAEPALQTLDGKTIPLEGDEETTKVLKDKRLAGQRLEVVGRFEASGAFAVNPIHTKAMFVHKDGKRHLITYWCEVCAIRTYIPGICDCCREETELDLLEAK